MSDIDLSDIARGRRITAVTASELEMVPRKAERRKRSKFARMFLLPVMRFLRRPV